MFVCVGLWYDYRIVKDTSEELLSLQEEYRSYILTLKGMIEVLARNNSEQEDSSEVSQTDEKKKSFVVVDRRPNYLRQSLINYIREKDLNVDVEEIDRIYKSYSDLPQVKKVRKKYSLRSLRRHRVSRRRSVTHQSPQPLPSSYEALPENIQEIVSSLPEAEDVVVQDVTFAWPIDRNQFWISSFFGRRKLKGVWGTHYGIDLAAIKGTPVKAIAGGKVLEAGFVRGYGNTVLVQHNQKYRSRYAHMNQIKVHAGQTIEAGRCIGTVGDTGYVKKSGRDASHLHLEIYRYGVHVNPLSVLA
jgi:murein DD-endopeptidase MepM/ murein hydrolase activator NlpD